MEGSRYPDGVLVDNATLKHTETTKAEQIKRLRTDVTSRGVYSGGVITANAVNTDRIDISAFSGYTPNGEWIEATSSNTNVALEDSTLGVTNVVFALYTENNTKYMPHESDGSTYPVYSEATYEIRTLNETDFANTSIVPLTDDNLDNIALDRCLILGYVVANGGGALSDFTYTSGFDNLKYSNPNQLSVISGVTVTAVDPDCPTGTATIRFDDTAAPIYKFYWTSPGGVISGVENVTVDSEVTITDGSGYDITLLIIISQLPSGLVVPYDESITIVDLYEQDPDRFTGEDVLHRSLVGNGIITPENPHGLSIDDLQGSSSSFLEEHQDTQHSNGIWRGSNSNTLYYTLSAGTSDGNVIQITTPPSGSLYYINGKKLNTLTNVTTVFDSATFAAGILGAGESRVGTKYYEFYVNDSAEVVPYRKATYPGVRNCTGTWIIGMNQGHPSGSYDLVLVISGGTTISASWGGGEAVSYLRPSTGGVANRVIRLYAPNEYDYVDLFMGDDILVSDGYLPTANNTYTDTITVYSPLKVDDNMLITGVSYWYDAIGSTGNLGFDPLVAPGSRSLVDYRPWGTLSTYELSDESNLELNEYPNSELQYSGILLSRQNQYDFRCSLPAPGLDVTLNGGIFYCRGKRFHVEGDDYTLTDNTTTVLWVDYEGNLHQDLFSATDFNSDYDQVIEWLVGHPQLGDPSEFLNYQGNGGVTPERGMPLWLITTLAGVVTKIEPMYRGVGKHIIDWSVGTDGGTVTTPTMGSGQFGDLRSAFAYAKLECENYKTNKSGITITVVGDVLIPSAVTQPSYVNVIGSNSSDAEITETVAAATGAWILSEGCRVSDIECLGGGGAFFKFANNVVIDHINYNSNAVAGSVLFTSDATVSNVIVQNCVFTPEYGVFNTGGGGAVTDLKLINNYIESSTYAGSNALVDLEGCTSVFISGNTFRKDNTSRSEALNISTSTDVSVSYNFVYLDPRAGGAGQYEHGIRLYDCTDAVISNNFVKMTSSSVMGLGISLYDVQSVVVVNNETSGMRCGVYCGTSTVQDISIKDNRFDSCKLAGIKLYDISGSITTVENINISNNIITEATKAVGADPDSDSTLSGIYINLISDNFTSIDSFVISNNIINSVVSSNTSTSVYGVRVGLQTDTAGASSIHNVYVNNNNISNLSLAAGSGAVAIFGIYAAFKAGVHGGADGLVENLTFSDNNIAFSNNNGDSANDDVVGLYFKTSDDSGDANETTSNVKFDNNIIHINDDDATANGTGLYIYSSSSTILKSKVVINNNFIDVSRHGILPAIDDSIISNNKIYAGASGIVMKRFTGSINSNFIHVYNSYEQDFIIVDPTPGTQYGSLGVALEDCRDFALDLNEIIIGDSGITLDDGSCNIYASYCCDFSISNNSTRQVFNSIAVVDPIWHCFIDRPYETFSIDKNIIFNGLKSSVSGITGVNGLWVLWTSDISFPAADIWGTIANNVIHGSNIAGVYELYLQDFSSMATGSTVTRGYTWHDNLVMYNGQAGVGVPRISVNPDAVYIETPNTSMYQDSSVAPVSWTSF